MGEFLRINTDSGKNSFGIKNTIPKDVYIEFVPGFVLDVVLNENSPAYGGANRNINSIIAMKHFGEKTNLKSMDLWRKDGESTSDWVKRCKTYSRKTGRTFK